MHTAPLEVLYEDNHCVAIAKPSGVTCAHFQGHEETLDRQVKEYLKDKYKKPGKVFLGIVHRLDKPVSGVILFARTSKAAARISEQFREGTIEKVYWAIVEGKLKKDAGTLEDWLRKNPETHRVDVLEPQTKGARQSLLHFQRKGTHGDLTWLDIRPQTGRTHQLRVQLAHHGHPIYGDSRYGSVATFGAGIALHARSLTFLHPVRYEPITITAELPDEWRERFLKVLHEAETMILDQLRDLIQKDIGKRGLRTDPERNLINACRDDFRLACQSIAEHPQPLLAVVTGFFIPTATPPAGETDGPLGALFLARALTPLGVSVILVTDDFCMRALEAGLDECGLRKNVLLIALPNAAQARGMSDVEYRQALDPHSITHLLAIERVGPTREGSCHTMRGRDITDLVSPAHRLFEAANRCVTIGIGDGGNEIGMGKIPADVIARNIPNGELVACRTATDHLIVCGVSNWGAYALAAGIASLRKRTPDATLFDPMNERRMLEIMVQAGPLVDGVVGKPSATVDGLTWDEYAGVLREIGRITCLSPHQSP